MKKLNVNAKCKWSLVKQRKKNLFRSNPISAYGANIQSACFENSNNTLYNNNHHHHLHEVSNFDLSLCSPQLCTRLPPRSHKCHNLASTVLYPEIINHRLAINLYKLQLCSRTYETIVLHENWCGSCLSTYASLLFLYFIYERKPCSYVVWMQKQKCSNLWIKSIKHVDTHMYAIAVSKWWWWACDDVARLDLWRRCEIS